VTGELRPEDLVVELGATIEWVEESRWYLPHHVRLRDGGWFVLPEDLHVWQHAWESATQPQAAA
jgi:hypothetical protein